MGGIRCPAGNSEERAKLVITSESAVKLKLWRLRFPREAQPVQPFGQVPGEKGGMDAYGTLGNAS